MKSGTLLGAIAAAVAVGIAIALKPGKAGAAELHDGAALIPTNNADWTPGTATRPNNADWTPGTATRPPNPATVNYKADVTKDTPVPAGNAVKQWLAAVIPIMEAVAPSHGIPVSIAIAQSILETTWGAAAPGNNLYGIKAGGGWKGPIVNIKTPEMYSPGKTTIIHDNFRAYPTMADSIADWAKFLHGPRYRYATQNFSNDPAKFSIYMWGAGYATADYYPKILANRSQQAAKLLGRPEIGFSLSLEQRQLVDRLTKIPAKDGISRWKAMREAMETAVA